MNRTVWTIGPAALEAALSASASAAGPREDDIRAMLQESAQATLSRLAITVENIDVGAHCDFYSDIKANVVIGNVHEVAFDDMMAA